MSPSTFLLFVFPSFQQVEILNPKENDTVEVAKTFLLFGFPSFQQAGILNPKENDMVVEVAKVIIDCVNHCDELNPSVTTSTIQEI